ncbi:uncharacterized protein LOC129230405 [Uloborus diversus]|uniref:uncharacterized protein LOC129230405 n=1 Tax=Uloborus diversus TaxID=327109 RepID=UPI00240A3339|nr:uncharacterized protein LOC129230405 [Uloborus diversus]
MNAKASSSAKKSPPRPLPRPPPWKPPPGASLATSEVRRSPPLPPRPEPSSRPLLPTLARSVTETPCSSGFVAQPRTIAEGLAATRPEELPKESPIGNRTRAKKKKRMECPPTQAGLSMPTLYELFSDPPAEGSLPVQPERESPPTSPAEMDRRGTETSSPESPVGAGTVSTSAVSPPASPAGPRSYAAAVTGRERETPTADVTPTDPSSERDANSAGQRIVSSIPNSPATQGRSSPAPRTDSPDGTSERLPADAPPCFVKEAELNLTFPLKLLPGGVMDGCKTIPAASSVG